MVIRPALYQSGRIRRPRVWGWSLAVSSRDINRNRNIVVSAPLERGLSIDVAIVVQGSFLVDMKLMSSFSGLGGFEVTAEVH